MKSDTAGSDIVAVMALIAIFVTVAAIFMVALLSHPIGDAAPVSICSCVFSGWPATPSMDRAGWL